MTAKPGILAGLVLLTVGAGVTTWLLHEQTEVARHAAAMLVQRTDQLRRQSVQWREQMAATATARAKREAQIAAATAANAAAKPTLEPAPPAKSGKPSFLEGIRTDPRVQNLFLQYQRSGLLIEYGPLFQELGLDRERIAKFIENVMKQRADEMDLQAALAAKGVTDTDQEAEEMRNRERQNYHDEQRSLLGNEGFARLANYEQVKPARTMVDAIAGKGVVNGIAFTPDQLKQLTVVVDQASRDPKTGYLSDRTDWARIDEQARGFLTPQQLEFIQTAETVGPMGAGWRFQAQLNDLITRGYEQDHPAKKG